MQVHKPLISMEILNLRPCLAGIPNNRNLTVFLTVYAAKYMQMLA